jgi:hypothetical protein
LSISMLSAIMLCYTDVIMSTNHPSRRAWEQET